MTTFKYGPGDSLIEIGPGVGRFIGSSGADTLTVDAGTLLYSLDESGSAWDTPLEFDGHGIWTVNFNGSAWSTATTGLFFDAGITGTKASTITIGAEGSVYGKYAGLNFGGFNDGGNTGPFANAPVTLTVVGEVGATLDYTAKGAGIYFNTTGAHIVTNTGHVYGYWGVYSEGNAADTITNSGRMSWVWAGDGANKLVNTGDLEGYSGGANADTFENNGAAANVGYSLYLGNGTNSVKNSGIINALVASNSDPGIVGGADADTVTNSGTVYGGIDLKTGANALTNSGQVDVDVDGYSYVGGGLADLVNNSGVLWGGVDLGGGPNSLTNSNQIYGAVFGGSGIDKLSNTVKGSMFVTVDLGGGNNTVSNFGFIADLVTGDGADTVTNEASGHIDHGVSLGGTGAVLAAIDNFTNKGFVGDASGISFTGAANGNKVANSGTMSGTVDLGNGTNTLTNSGAIGVNQSVAIYGGINADSVTNTKAILGAVYLGDGANHLTNSGSIGEDTSYISYNTGLGNGVDTIVNSGTIIGIVITGDGNDSFTDYSGTVQGKVLEHIEMGAGDDKFYGGSNAETVLDQSGNDNYSLGGGNDTFWAALAPGSGTDTVDGGAGIDTYDAADATGAVHINLATTTQYDTFQDPVVTLNVSQASGADTGTDIIKLFENAYGGAANDIIVGTEGTTAANLLMGNGGNDHIAGLGGNDTLIGGAGSDGLLGGAGKDYLTGGDTSAPDGTDDYFVYTKLSDSGVAAATRDVITDFEVGTDKIVLTDLETSTGHAFNFIGTNVAFSHVAGQIHAYWTVSGQIVEGDTNGDGRADFSIELHGLTPDQVLSGSDFFL